MCVLNLGSAEELVPVLEKVFQFSKIKPIALNIDSHGGQPFESERERIRREGEPQFSAEFLERTLSYAN